MWLQRLFEMLLDKLRVNVIVIALLVTFIIVDFGDKLISLLSNQADRPPTGDHGNCGADRNRSWRHDSGHDSDVRESPGPC